MAKKRILPVEDLKKIAAKLMLDNIVGFLPTENDPCNLETPEHRIFSLMHAQFGLDRPDFDVIYKFIEKSCDMLRKQSGELAEVKQVIGFLDALYGQDELDKEEEDRENFVDMQGM